MSHATSEIPLEDPWHVEEDAGEIRIVSGGMVVCRMGGKTDYDRRAARLIAAAPSVAAAVKEATYYLSMDGAYGLANNLEAALKGGGQ